MNAKVPLTIAFVDKRAISAGSLISLAAKKIVMSSGSTMGAATPIYATGEKASEKVNSYMRAEMKSTAETNHRDPRFAVAMVDETNGLDSSSGIILPPGKLLTLTTDDALKIKYADTTAETIDAALAAVGIQPTDIINTEESFGDKLIRFLTSAIVSSLLIMIGMAGAFYTIKTGHFGAITIAAVAAFALFFGGQYITSIAPLIAIVLFLVGITLLLIEVSPVPTFGLAGVLGIIGVVAGLFLALAGNLETLTPQRMTQTFVTLAISLSGVIVLGYLIVKYGPKATWLQEIPQSRYYCKIRRSTPPRERCSLASKVLRKRCCARRESFFSIIVRSTPSPAGNLSHREPRYRSFKCVAAVPSCKRLTKKSLPSTTSTHPNTGIHLREEGCRRMLKRDSLLWPIASLAVILLIVFYPYIFGGKIMLPTDMYDTMTSPSNAQYGPPQAQNHYFYDALVQGYPYKLRTETGIRSGTLAYWDPYILGGYPAYAESLAGNFDVFNVFGLWIEPLNLITTQIILEMLIAGFGLYLLVSFFSVDGIIALLFSLAFMLNSMFISSITNRWVLGSFCWVPFTTLMILHYFSGRGKTYLIYASIFLSLSFLGGTFQTSFFIAFIAIIIFIFYPSAVRLGTRISAITIVGITAFLLSAIMWLPSLELFFRTLRDGGSLNSTSVYAKYSVVQRMLSVPLAFLYFHFPSFAGGPQNYSQRSVPMSILPISMALSVFCLHCLVFGVALRLGKNTKLRPFIILSVCGLALPILTPLYSILYHRFFIVAGFGLCVVGAVAFQSFIDDAGAVSVP